MAFEYKGKKYRSYKHPILEYIFDKALTVVSELPDEIIFTYEDIRQAMDTLGIRRDKQASLSNFTIDLTRQAASHESRVPPSVWERGYDLDRVPEREARHNVAGRLIRKELKPREPWIVWPEIDDTNTITISNQTPPEIQLYLGKDEGALLSVMDYCDVLSLAIHNQLGTVKRVQHPRNGNRAKWMDFICLPMKIL